MQEPRKDQVMDGAELASPQALVRRGDDGVVAWQRSWQRPWRRSIAAILGCVLLAGATSACLAQSASPWPARTVKVVVPYAPGGVTDTMARLTADRLGKMLGQTFYIENRSGAGGAIGIDYALHSPRDGYTLLFLGSQLL